MLYPSGYQYFVWGEEIEVVPSYKYLGVHMDEHLTFVTGKQQLASAAGRALGALIYRCHGIGDIGYSTFNCLFDSCVGSILDYSAAVWGFGFCKDIEDIQSRAARYFLGTGKYMAIPSLNAEMGWISTQSKRLISIVCYYNAVVKMPDDRLPKMVFKEYRTTVGSWGHNVGVLLSDMGYLTEWENLECIDLDDFVSKIRDRDWIKNRSDMMDKPKLEFLNGVKLERGVSSYVRSNIPKYQRSLISRLRNGSLHLRIETGRFQREKREDRICELCKSEVEDTKHFLYSCTALQEIRERHGVDIGSEILDHPHLFGKFLSDLWSVRQKQLFDITNENRK